MDLLEGGVRLRPDLLQRPAAIGVSHEQAGQCPNLDSVPSVAHNG
jgi:hypothetical protein